MSNITIIIKTFQRLKSLECLLKSIEDQKLNNIPIIILDDSRENYKDAILEKFSKLNINYIVTEFDIGLSKGRNILLEHVKTDYIILCDDDFEFDSRTNISKGLLLLKEYNLDILGGSFYERVELNSIFSVLHLLKHPKYFIDLLNGKETNKVYNGFIEITSHKVLVKSESNGNLFLEKDIYQCDFVNNFFIAKTDSIKKLNGWQPEYIKLAEHMLFFIRCKQHFLSVAYTHHLGVKHHPYKSLEYSKYRLRALWMRELAFKFLNLNIFEHYDMNKNLLYKYESKE